MTATKSFQFIVSSGIAKAAGRREEGTPPCMADNMAEVLYGLTDAEVEVKLREWVANTSTPAAALRAGIARDWLGRPANNIKEK